MISCEVVGFGACLPFGSAYHRITGVEGNLNSVLDDGIRFRTISISFLTLDLES